MWLGGTLKKSSNTFCVAKNTRKISSLYAMVGCVKLNEVDLYVCECAGKAESHPGRQTSSHSCLAKVL